MNNIELNSINKPKEEIYNRIAHKIYEAQEEHKLYFGETITTVVVKGKQIKQVNSDAKLLILYVSNLLLFSKKSDAIKTIDEYGKYFYDKHLCEANLRRLRALSLMDTSLDLKTNGEAIQEFIKAKILFEQNDCDQGQGLCCAAIGYMIYEFILKFPGNKTDLLNFAKIKFIESLTFYEKIDHKYGMSYCYDMIHEIKRDLGENSTQEYLNHINLLKIIKQDILQEKIKFIERTQGAEFSLFIENIFTIESKESINNLDATTPSGLVKNVIEKKLLIEKLQDKMNQRLEILNQLLVNHAIRQNSHNINPPPLNIVKNNINLINPTFLSKPSEQNFEWTKALFMPSSIKGSKSISKVKGKVNSLRNSLEKLGDNYTEKRKCNNTKKNKIEKLDLAPLVKPMLKKLKKTNSKVRRKSTDANLTNKQQMTTDIVLEAETPTKVRLYYNKK